MPGPLFWRYLPQHLLLNLIDVVWFVLRGQGRVILRAKWDALRGLPRCWRKRAIVQSQRRVSPWGLRELMRGGLLALYRRG